MWAPSRAAFFYARPVLLFPAFDGRLIPLQSAPFRFLHAPPQAMQQTADVIPMVLDLKLAANEFGNAGRGPQIRPPAMRGCPLEKHPDQTLTLGLSQLPGTARRKTHLESLRPSPAAGIPPAHHRNGSAADTPSHFVQRITAVQQRQRAPAPIFQEIGTPSRSWHSVHAKNRAPTLLHYLCRNQ
jgi:hypothetical protein